MKEATVIKPKSMQQIWQVHKELLRRSNPTLPMDWNKSLPDDREAFGLLVLRQRRWLKPRDPIEVTESYLKDTVGRLKPQIEEVWGHKIEEMPFIDHVSPPLFFARLNHHQAMTNKAFGYGELHRLPPAMASAPYHKTIFLPERFMLVEPDSSPKGFNYTDVPWDRAYFEGVLTEEISHALFRQARGEWSTDFVKAMKAVGSEAELIINRLAEASAQLAKERLCSQNKEWGFYVGIDAIKVLWGDSRTRGSYAGLDALSQNMTLVRASMIDYLMTQSGDRMAVGFFSDHPSCSKKKEVFDNVLRS